MDRDIDVTVVCKGHTGKQIGNFTGSLQGCDIQS